MPEQIFIGNFAKGLKLDRLPFNIDNDAFPTMYNFYSWRGRAKRKRGTLFLGQLQVQVQSVVTSTPPENWQVGTIAVLDGSGNASVNLISLFSLPATVSITPGSIQLTDGTNNYTEPTPPDGTLIGTPSGTGTINYATGALTITGGAPGGTLVGKANVTSFSYFPSLPVMGLRDFVSTTSSSQYPLLLAFDTQRAYQINQTASAVFFYNVSYYKGTNTPFVWHGADYQQFWTTNYSAALWATNNVPGFHFLTGSYSSGSTTPNIIFDFAIPGGAAFTTLIVGDKLWFNQWSTGGSTINGIVGTVSNVSGTPGRYTVTFSGNQTVAGTGIAQMLTNSLPNQDGIKWYDGDPTNGSGLPTGSGLGWVNFAPPLTATSVSIDNTPSALYYLVGALAIVAFKDRLIFFSPYIQSTAGFIAGAAPIQLQDTALWSWNGTPYYASPVPTGETFDVTAYYVDQTGKGGFISAGISQPIVTVSNNEDVLLVGFGGNIGRQTRFVYTGNDLYPFLFFNINQELGSSATFSAIALDRGALTIGSHGIALTTQQSAARIDLDIPDAVFDIQGLNNGVQRINAVRDYYKEWIYFSYPANNSPWKFPTQTFLYNYRDNTWSILYENFTAHGTYRKQSHFTWATLPFKTWAQWREPWNAGSTSALFPDIVAGNPQGYVLIIGQGTGEGRSGTIQAIGSSSGNTQITSTNHCVAQGDYIYFQGALGSLNSTITAISQAAQAVITTTNTFSVGQYVQISQVTGMTEINGRIVQIVSATGSSITVDINTTTFSVYSGGGIATVMPLQQQIALVLSTPSANTFVVDIPYVNLGYIGLGQYTRLSQPLLQTKQFPVYWNEGRQVRLAVQKYLMDTTSDGQVTINIYLSQDPNDIWNNGSIVPVTDPDPSNNSLIYSQILYTCPESTNIGLTPSNINLQMPTAANQYQIWHRFNTSLIGDSVQIGITLSNDTPGKKDAQMRSLDYATSEITLHGIHLIFERGPLLA